MFRHDVLHSASHQAFLPITDMRDHHNDRLRWTIFLLSILTWILSVMAVADCTFVRIGPRSIQYRNLSEAGLFSFNYDLEGGHRCLAYDSTVKHDAAVKTAQAFACLASILTGFSMLQVVSLQMFLQWKTDLFWKLIRVEVFAATFYQAIVFAGFGTDECVDDPYIECLPGPAGIINAINILLLAVVSWLCLGMAPPANPIFEVKRFQTENSHQDSKNEVISTPDMAPATIDGDVEAINTWGVTAQKPKSVVERSESDMAVYAGSNHKSLKLPARVKQTRGPEVQTPVMMTMRESPGADPVENNRCAQVESTGVYEGEEYEYQYSSELAEKAQHPHRHHHKKKRHHLLTRDAT